MIRILLLVLVFALPANAQTAELLGRYTWSPKDDRILGLSALHLDASGTNFTALSDRGYFVSGRLTRKDGAVSAVTRVQVNPVQMIKGGKVTGYDSDSEGIAVTPNGAIYVSFEGFHRVRRYASTKSRAKHVPSHPDFKSLQNNSSLEALASDKWGRLYAIPERSGKLDRPFPVYRYQGGKWDKRLSIPRRGDFLVVGADFGPDGDFYVLERDFTWFGGFASRLRKFTLTPKGFRNEKTLFRTRTGFHDNLEGISVWRDAQGRTRITLVSDDNDSAFQRTEFVDYVLK
jgi:hypothetical protein